MTKKECSCEKCINCCKNIPGITLPNDIIKIAEYLKLSIFETLEKYFIRGYRYVDIFNKGEDIHINIAYPARKGFANTREDWGYPLLRGNCTFLKNDLCIIHEVKPYECKMSFGCEPKTNFRQTALKGWHKAIENKTLHKDIIKFLGIQT